MIILEVTYFYNLGLLSISCNFWTALTILFLVDVVGTIDDTCSFQISSCVPCCNFLLCACVGIWFLWAFKILKSFHYTKFCSVDVQGNQCFCRNFLLKEFWRIFRCPFNYIMFSFPLLGSLILFPLLIAGVSFDCPFICLSLFFTPFLFGVWNETVYSTFRESKILCCWCILDDRYCLIVARCVPLSPLFWL